MGSARSSTCWRSIRRLTQRPFSRVVECRLATAIKARAYPSVWRSPGTVLVANIRNECARLSSQARSMVEPHTSSLEYFSHQPVRIGASPETMSWRRAPAPSNLRASSPACWNRSPDVSHRRRRTCRVPSGRKAWRAHGNDFDVAGEHRPAALPLLGAGFAVGGPGDAGGAFHVGGDEDLHAAEATPRTVGDPWLSSGGITTEHTDDGVAGTNYNRCS